jgi:hypothetical protein
MSSQQTKEVVMKLTVSTMLVAAAIAVAPFSSAQTQPQPEPQSAPQTEQPAPMPDSSAQQGGAVTESSASPNTRLAAMVPAGMSAESACMGFKSLSECSAALHVSQNLRIPFADVKDRVASGQSLTAAVHALKPAANSRKEVRRAEDQAREDLKPMG